MADGNNNDQNNGGKQKGGGGNQAKEGLTLTGNINAAAMGSTWPGIKKVLADQTLNASGLIIAGIGIFVLKKAVYKLFSIDEAAAVKPPVSAYEGIGALYQLKNSNPDKFESLRAKHAELFGGGHTIDVTPEPQPQTSPPADNGGGDKHQQQGKNKK